MKVITTQKEAWEAYNKMQPAIKKEKAKWSFKSKEFENLKQTLISNEPLNPQTDLVKFNRVISERGYSFFDQRSIDNWKECYSLFTNDDIKRMAEVDLRLLLNSVKNIADKDHDKNRLLFASQFGSNEAKAKEFFNQQNNDLFGRSTMAAMRDTSYESRFLNFGQITSNHQAFELETFRKLIGAKWNALGYYQDAEYKQKFLRDYCIALSRL